MFSVIGWVSGTEHADIKDQLHFPPVSYKPVFPSHKPSFSHLILSQTLQINMMTNFIFKEAIQRTKILTFDLKHEKELTTQNIS